MVKRGALGEAGRREALAERCRVQAGFCRALGSPLYAELLERAAADAETGGPVWSVFEGQAEMPADSAPLVLMGAVHRLVLTGEAPELAPFYPSATVASGTVVREPDIEGVWAAFRSLLSREAERVRGLMDRPVQTNEVGRSGALLGGFLTVARSFPGLSLRLAEIGAAAGLNLRWDRYRYESGGAAWGDPGSPVRFVDVFSGGGGPLEGGAPVSVPVAERAGCDLSPVDPGTGEGRLTLMSFVWADQVERFARLRGALEIAREVPASVEAADAFDWLPSRLAAAAPGTALVVFHSVVTLYFTPDERLRLASLLEETGFRATRESPVAWLRMEHPDTGDPAARGWSRLGKPEVRLTVWPGGEERLLARSAAHGPPVEWLGR